MDTTTAHVRNALLIGGLAVVVTLIVMVGARTSAAGRSISGRGVVDTAATNTIVPTEFTQTTPFDDKLVGGKGELQVQSTTKVYQNVGQTAVGGPQKPVTRKRITARKLDIGKEISFKGTYTTGDKLSMKPSEITLHDRTFTICGKYQGLTQRTAAGANENAFTIQISKVTVQEARVARTFPVGKDVKFSYGDTTKFHNANGSWKAPKNRVAVQPGDIRADQQVTVVKGEVTGVNKIDATDVDLGVKCP